MNDRISKLESTIKHLVGSNGSDRRASTSSYIPISTESCNEKCDTKDISGSYNTGIPTPSSCDSVALPYPTFTVSS